MLRRLIYFKRSFCSGNEREGPLSAVSFRAAAARRRRHSHMPRSHGTDTTVTSLPASAPVPRSLVLRMCNAACVGVAA